MRLLHCVRNNNTRDLAGNDRDGHNLYTLKYYIPKYAILGTKVNLTMVIFQRHPPLYDFRHHHRNDLKS